MNRLQRRSTVLLVVLILAQIACLSSADSGETPKAGATPAAGAAVAAPLAPASQPTAAPTLPQASPPTQPPAPSGNAPGTWLVILYQHADDQPLEGGAHMDLNEAERVGPSERVTIVSQYDRFVGGFEGDGGWSGSRRYLVRQGNDLDVIESDLVQDLGEVDSGDTQTLIDFALWAIQSYPADHYVLTLSDHGGGWIGGWSDNDPLAGSSMTMDEIDQAIGEIVRQSGIPGFELILFDACLMAQLESLSALTPYARYAIASEEIVPGIGLAYREPLAALQANPDMSSADLARAFVGAYVDRDEFIVDPLNRMVMALVRGLAVEATSEQIAATFDNITLGAYDLSQLQGLTAALNELAAALTRVDQTTVAEARSFAQSYTSVFGNNVPESFIDLGHWASLLQERLQDNPQAMAALENLQAALSRTVIAEKHAPQRPGSTGISIFFPNSSLFELTFAPDAPQNYEASTRRFSGASLWDDFLRFHYTGRPMDIAAANLSLVAPLTAAAAQQPLAPETPVPEVVGEVSAPGAGSVVISPITLSAESIDNEETAILTTEINATNLAYLYNYVFWLQEETGDVQTVDVDFVAWDETQELNGVVFPVWGDESFTLDFEWTPNIYYISNGSEEIFAVLEPETFAADTEDITYLTAGWFVDSELGEERRGFIRFTGDGQMNSVWVYTNPDGTGTPSEIIPTPGDSFTVVDYWLEYTNNPDGELVEYGGDTITFGETPLTWTGYPPIGGTYIVGIAAEDLDGNTYFEFVSINVTE
jgi:hypothetical protein